MDHVVDQAIDYMDRFNQSQGYLVRPNKGPTKQKEQDLKVDDQDGYELN